MTPSRYLNADDAAARFGDLAQTYAASLMRADPAADALIEALHHTSHHGPWWSMVLAALSDGVESVPEAPAELRAFVAALCHVAAVLGIDDELLALVNEADCLRFWELWFLTNPGPDADTAALANASLKALAAMAGGGALTRRAQFPILCGATRWLLGEDICDGLKIPRTAWSHVLPLSYRPAVKLSEFVGALMKQDRSRAVARSIHLLATGNAAVGVMPKGTGVVAEPARLEALARFKPVSAAPEGTAQIRGG